MAGESDGVAGGSQENSIFNRTKGRKTHDKCLVCNNIVTAKGEVIKCGGEDCKRVVVHKNECGMQDSNGV
jgi:hypothetical protein